MSHQMMAILLMVAVAVLGYFAAQLIAARFGVWSQWEKAYRAPWPEKCDRVYRVSWGNEPIIFVAPTAKGIHARISRWGLNAPIFVPWSDVSDKKGRAIFISLRYLYFARAPTWALRVVEEDALEILSYRSAA